MNNESSMMNEANFMKIIQTEVSDAEYKIIESYVKKQKISIRKLIKDAVLEKIINTEISNEDSLFKDIKNVTGFKDGSINHDKYLIGEEK